jgi:hypothetical protein
LRKNLIASGAVAGALLLGSAGAALVVPALVSAADPSAAPAASPSASGAPGADDHAGECMGGTTEAVSDASVAAAAIGITETELNNALQGGQTIAGVAKAHNVDVQTVIDALVADKQDEVAAALKAGTISQAQADRALATATQFVTDQVNRTGFGSRGPGGGHGHGPMGGPGAGNGTPSTSPSASAGASG